MITKEELMTIPGLHREMVRGVQQLHWLEEKGACIPSTGQGNPNKVQTSVSNHAGFYAESAIDLRSDLERKHVILEHLKALAKEWIDTFDDDRTRRILTKRYVKVVSWKLIAESEGLTLRRCYQINNQAISHLD